MADPFKFNDGQTVACKGCGAMLVHNDVAAALKTVSATDAAAVTKFVSGDFPCQRCAAKGLVVDATTEVARADGPPEIVDSNEGDWDPRPFSPQKGMKIRVRVGARFAKEKGFKSRDLDGTVQAIAFWKEDGQRYDGSEYHAGDLKSVLLNGHATVAEADNCHRCGRDLTKFASRWAGYGEWCADTIGVPYREDLSDAEKQAIRERIYVDTQFEEWVAIKTIRLWKGLATPTTSQPATTNGASPAANAQPDAVLTVDKTDIVLKAGYAFRDVCGDLALELVGRKGDSWDPQAKAWTYPATPYNAYRIREKLAAAGAQKVRGDDGYRALYARGKETSDGASPLPAPKVAAPANGGASPSSSETTSGSSATASVMDGAASAPVGRARIPLTKTPAWKHQEDAFWFICDLWGGLPG